MNAQNLSRRRLLQSLAVSASLATALAPRVWAQAAPTRNGIARTGRLVVVLLRGAYDGLSAFVPYTDADYYAMRPNISIAAPDGTAQTALRLDATFALHPALAPLLPLWQQGVLGIVPAAGLPAPNRSHFDAQYQMEIAQTNKTSMAPGWLNRLAGLHKSSAPMVLAMGVGEANPAILAGDAPVKLIPRGQAAERTGVLASTSTRQALLDLYAGNDAVSVAFRNGADSRMQSAQMLAASNGATDPVGLQLDAQHLGTLMRNDRNLQIGFLSAGGWDTHANQGNVSGQLANNLANLAHGITQLRQDFNESGDVILVMSEFGRTSAENGTRGTDHGFGNALWLIGNQVNGGQWHGQWTGLGRGNLNENRDLPAHHDYRAVLAQVLRRSMALPDTALATLLPGANWDARLDGLMRKA